MATECVDCAIGWHDDCADRRRDTEERDGCCCGRIPDQWDDEGEA